MSFAREPDAVLVAEGDALIRMVMVDMLTDAGFAPVAVPDAAQALAALAARPALRALITGRTLRQTGDGIGLVQRVRAARPDLAILITSGAASDLHAMVPAGVRVLWKPFQYHELAQAIAEEIRPEAERAAAPVVPEGVQASPLLTGAAAAAPVSEPDKS